MRRLPMILAGVFLAITLTRVATLAADGMNAGLLGWLFSAGLGLGVFVSAYYTWISVLDRSGAEDRRSRQVRYVAAGALILFMLADGYFNLVEVRRSVTDPTLQTPALIYGLFPTLAAALLGALQGYVDRLPRPPVKYSIGVALRAWAVGMIPRADADLAEIPQAASAAAAALPQVSQPAKIYECACGYASQNQRSYAAHRAHCHRAAKVEVEI